jgi:hypothetical protein
MAGHVSQLASPDRRLSALVAPREHGAWGLLLVPLVTGGIVGILDGGSSLPLAAFTLAALALFWLRTPLESWLGTGILRAQTSHERQSVAVTCLGLAAVAASALTFLFVRGNRDLLWLGSIAAAAFLVQALLRKLSRKTRMVSQIVGTIGLAITAPAAYYVVTERLDRNAWALWIVNILFAGNQVHFVQMRIHSARLSGWAQKIKNGRDFLIGEVLLVIALFSGWRLHVFPGLVTVAFLPLLMRGSAWFVENQKPLAVRRLGWTELAHAIVFGIILIAAFDFSH